VNHSHLIEAFRLDSFLHIGLERRESQEMIQEKEVPMLHKVVSSSLIRRWIGWHESERWDISF